MIGGSVFLDGRERPKLASGSQVKPSLMNCRMISHPRSLIRCIGAIAAVLCHVFIALPVLGLQQKPIVESLRSLDPNVLTEAARKEHAQKLASNVRSRITAANRRSSDEWRQISNRAQWEQFAKGKLQLLEASLGTFPSPSKKHGSPSDAELFQATASRSRTRCTKAGPGSG